MLAIMAGRLALKAVTLGGGLRARLVAASALHAVGRPQDADALLADLDPGEATERERVELAVNRATILLYGFGRSAAAASVLETAQAEVGNPDWHAEQAALRAEMSLRDQDPHAALEAATGVAARADIGDRATLRALAVAVQALAIQGRSQDAIDAVEHAREVSARLEVEPPHATLELIELSAALPYAMAGRLDEHERRLRRHYQEALEHQNPAMQALWAFACGACKLYRGEVRSAAAQLGEAARLLREHPTILGPYGLAWCLGDLATAHALSGRPEWAAAALADAGQALPGAVSCAPRDRGHVWLTATRGAVSQARAASLDAAAQVRARGYLAFELTALHDAARLGAAGCVAGRLEELAASADGPLVRTFALHGRALARCDATMLARAAGGFEEIGALMLAAEGWADAAEAYRRAGRTGRAAGGAANAGRLNDACERPQTPTLRRLDAHGHLTSREQEVVELVRAGHNSRQIAERLVVSERTVESHRWNAYQKLGVHNARELHAIFDAETR